MQVSGGSDQRVNTNVNRSGADASPRCSEGYREVPMRHRDVPRQIKVCRGCLMDISGCEYIGRLMRSDGDGDRRCRSVGRLYNLIRNMDFRDDV